MFMRCRGGEEEPRVVDSELETAEPGMMNDVLWECMVDEMDVLRV